MDVSTFVALFLLDFDFYHTAGGLIFIFGCRSVKLNYIVHYNFVHILYLTTYMFVGLIFYFWLFI